MSIAGIADHGLSPTNQWSPRSSRMASALFGRPSPRLPERRLGIAGPPLAFAGALHLLAAAVFALLIPAAGQPPPLGESVQPTANQVVRLPAHLVFLPKGLPGGGGGGGGNRQSAPIRKAEGVGHDAATMRTAPRRRTTAALDVEPAIPALVLDAQPLASGVRDQIGLPVGGVSYGTSTGSGSGGGVGTGTGTGLGSGRGDGVGPGSGGGFGGGAYRPGGAVSAPRVRSQVKPRYTVDALQRKIEGSVWLDLVVTSEGRAGAIRVAQSIDPGGLDEEAIAAVRLWQFEPGRLAGRAVDVAVTVVIDFAIR